jgi:hypothetical protein
MSEDLLGKKNAFPGSIMFSIMRTWITRGYPPRGSKAGGLAIGTHLTVLHALYYPDPPHNLTYNTSTIPLSLRFTIFVLYQQTTFMYVIHEKAFQYSVILTLKPTDENTLIKVLKREQLRTDIKNLGRTLRRLRKVKGSHARTSMLIDPGLTLITFYRWENDALDYGALSHEIFHAVDMNLRAKGVALSDHSDEVYAHHMGYFTREFYNQIWSKK